MMWLLVAFLVAFIAYKAFETYILFYGGVRPQEKIGFMAAQFDNKNNLIGYLGIDKKSNEYRIYSFNNVHKAMIWETQSFAENACKVFDDSIEFDIQKVKVEE